jgi:hypothetical protein
VLWRQLDIDAAKAKRAAYNGYTGSTTASVELAARFILSFARAEQRLRFAKPVSAAGTWVFA